MKGQERITAKRTIYGAYGANTNVESMKYRCPDAKFIGTAELPGYRLEYKGVADIVEHDTAMVVALWECTRKCMEALDHFEGWPHLYRRETLTCVDSNGNALDVVFYIMNGRTLGEPSIGYHETLLSGYAQCGMEVQPILEALERATLAEQERRAGREGVRARGYRWSCLWDQADQDDDYYSPESGDEPEPWGDDAVGSGPQLSFDT